MLGWCLTSVAGHGFIPLSPSPSIYTPKGFVPPSFLSLANNSSLDTDHTADAAPSVLLFLKISSCPLLSPSFLSSYILLLTTPSRPDSDHPVCSFTPCSPSCRTFCHSSGTRPSLLGPMLGGTRSSASYQVLNTGNVPNARGPAHRTPLLLSSRRKLRVRKVLLCPQLHFRLCPRSYIRGGKL